MVPRSSVDREFEYIVGRAVGKSSQSLPKASQSLTKASPKPPRVSQKPPKVSQKPPKVSPKFPQSLPKVSPDYPKLPQGAQRRFLMILESTSWSIFEHLKNRFPIRSIIKQRRPKKQFPLVSANSNCKKMCEPLKHRFPI